MILLPHRRRTMPPKKPETRRSDDLFRARLDQIINLKHELAQLAGQIDWDFIDGEIAPLYSDKGRPGIPTRFAIGLLLEQFAVDARRSLQRVLNAHPPDQCAQLHLDLPSA
jgi:hypothetical protein